MLSSHHCCHCLDVVCVGKGRLWQNGCTAWKREESRLSATSLASIEASKPSARRRTEAAHGWRSTRRRSQRMRVRLPLAGESMLRSTSRTRSRQRALARRIVKSERAVVMRQTWAVDRAGDGHSDRQRPTASQSRRCSAGALRSFALPRGPGQQAAGCRQRRLSLKLNAGRDK